MLIQDTRLNFLPVELSWNYTQVRNFFLFQMVNETFFYSTYGGHGEEGEERLPLATGNRTPPMTPVLATYRPNGRRFCIFSCHPTPFNRIAFAANTSYLNDHLQTNDL